MCHALPMPLGYLTQGKALVVTRSLSHFLECCSHCGWQADTADCQYWLLNILMFALQVFYPHSLAQKGFFPPPPAMFLLGLELHSFLEHGVEFHWVSWLCAEGIDGVSIPPFHFHFTTEAGWANPLSPLIVWDSLLFPTRLFCFPISPVP